MNARRFTISAVAALLLSSPALAVEKLFPYPYETKTFSNGLTAVVIPMPTPGLVTYFTVVRTGSRDEVEPGRSGYAHFFEHMMFRGTKRYPGPEYQRIVTELGARANAFTSDDLTAFHLTFDKDDLEKVIEIESDRFQNLDYGRPAFQTEAGAIYGEYRIGAANPWFALHEKMQDLAYDAHTYKHTTMGFEADVKAMPEAYDYSREFHHRFYRPENVVLLIVGDVDPAATFALVKKYYGAWKPGYQAPKIVPEPPQTAPRSAEIAFPGRTLPILALAYKGDAFDPSNRDYVAAELLGELAFGPQSDLYKKLVLREQKVEVIHCDIPMNRDQPLFEVVAVVKNAADIPAVREEIGLTLEQFKTKPVDLQKLDDLKRRNRYAFVMDLDTTDKTATTLARFIAVGADIKTLERFFAESEKVTPQDIQRAARKYFVPERRTEVVLKGTEEQAAGESTPSNQVSEKAESGKPKAKKNDGHSRSPNPSTPTEKSSPLTASSFLLGGSENDPTACFRIWFRVGSRDDPPGKEGLAAVTAAMIAEGATRSNSYEQILDKLFPLAADYSASVSVEMTVLSGRVHKDNLDRYYPLLIDAIREPAFKQEDLDRIKSQTLNYLENTLRYSGDEELGKAVLYNTIFAGTCYGHLPEGTIDGVRSITIDDVKQFFSHYYRQRENVCIGLDGDFGAETVAKFQRDLADLGDSRESSGARLMPPKPAPIDGRHVTIVEKNCAATALSIGFPIKVLRGSADWYALAVANSWLGQHRNQNGRLFYVLREIRGLNYGDYSYIEHFPGGSRLLMPPVNVGRRQQIFEMWIRPVPHAAAHFALRASLWELKNLVDNGLTEDEFQEARGFLRKYVVHLAPTTMDRLGYALDDQFYGIDGSHLDKFRQQMDELTLAKVNAAVKKYLQYENLDIVFVTKDAASLKAALAGDAPSPITYPTPKPESVLAEDREIGVFPLKIKSDDIRIVPVTELFIK